MPTPFGVATHRLETTDRSIEEKKTAHEYIIWYGIYECYALRKNLGFKCLIIFKYNNFLGKKTRSFIQR